MTRRRIILASLALTFVAGPPAWADTGLAIVQWNRPMVSLYRTPQGTPERRDRRVLPQSAHIDEIADPFFRFTDPATRETWFVLQNDVTTNHPAASDVPPQRGGPCQVTMGMGVASGCRR